LTAAVRTRLPVWLILVVGLTACGTMGWRLTPPTAERYTAPAPSVLAEHLESRQTAASDSAEATYRPWVVVAPFYEDAGFRDDVFDLPRDLPRMLEPLLAARDICRVVPAAAVEVAVAGRDHRWVESHQQELSDMLMADFLVVGALHTYKFERLHVGNPLVAGYKSYVGTVELSARMFGGSPLGLIGSVQITRESQNRGLGLDLLGKPREGDEQFNRLEHMRFDSDEFRATALGEATVQALQQLATELDQLLRPGELTDLDEEPQILSVFGDEVFINLGHTHGVRLGYRFTVSGSAHVDPPVVEVRDVISDNVSRVVALRGGGLIEPGQRVELIGVGVEEEE